MFVYLGIPLTHDFHLYFQVALGSHRLCETGAEPECEGAGCDSTLAVGRQTPDNTYDVTLPSGIYPTLLLHF